MKQRISYTIWGIEKDSSNWINWYFDVQQLFASFGYDLTHIGITSDTFKSNKILTVSRNEKKLLKAIQGGEIPHCIECYSLKPDYKIAMFDCKILCSRSDFYITTVINDFDLAEDKEHKILELEKKYFNIEKGEVYYTSDKEVPMIYADTKDSGNLETYKFIKNIS